MSQIKIRALRSGIEALTGLAGPKRPAEASTPDNPLNIQRVLRSGLCVALWLLALASLSCAPAAAQGCEDCAIIKGKAPAATLTTEAGAAPLSATATNPPLPPDEQSAPAAVVHVVFYWAEGCGHCHEVLDGLLPQLQQQYGSQLAVRLIEVVSLEDISAFFAVAEDYGYARGQASVPFLLIGDRALMGVAQIEAELPGLVAALLAAGGADWPTQAQVTAFGTPSAQADACGFTAPCEDQDDATGAAEEVASQPAAGAAEKVASQPATARQPGGAWAAVGLIVVIGAGSAIFLTRRARNRAAG